MQNIFVSSSFKDMQKERDLIHSIVLPEINEFLRTRYGMETTMVDLRWGIDTSRVSELNAMLTVLRVCRTEVEHCKPFMIVLIGDRYGSIVKKKTLHKIIQDDQFEEMAIDDISVTEFEIRYAMHLAQSSTMNCYYYFRDANYTDMPVEIKRSIYIEQSTMAKMKLNKLKEEIQERYADRCRHYQTRWDCSNDSMCGYDQFTELIISDLKRCIIEELGQPRVAKPIELATMSECAFIRTQQAQFVGRIKECDKIKEFIESKDAVMMFLHGASGVGKSSLMANIPHILSNQNWEFISVFCGSNDLCDTASGVMQSIVYKLLQNCKSEHVADSLADAHDESQWHCWMDSLINQYLTETGKTLVVLIDAVDQMLPDLRTKKLYFVPSNLGERLKVIISLTSEHRKEFLYPNFGKIIELQMLAPNQEDIKAIIDGIWMKYGKVSVASGIKKRLLKKPLCGNFLYLNILLSRLTFLGEELFGKRTNSEKSIRREMQKIISSFPDSLEAAASELMRVLGVLVDPVLTQEVVMYLSASPNGLRSTDLEDLCDIHWSGAQFAYIRKLFGSFVFERMDHRIDFTHKVFRNAFDKISSDAKKPIYERLYQYACSLPDQDAHKAEYLIYSAYHSNHIRGMYEILENWLGSDILRARAAWNLSQLIRRDEAAAIVIAEQFPMGDTCSAFLDMFVSDVLPLLPPNQNKQRFCSDLYCRFQQLLDLKNLRILELKRLYLFAKMYLSVRRDYTGIWEKADQYLQDIAQQIMEKEPNLDAVYTYYNLKHEREDIVTTCETVDPFLNRKETQVILMVAKYLIKYGQKHFVAVDTERACQVNRYIEKAVKLLNGLNSEKDVVFGYEIVDLFILAGEVYLQVDRIKDSKLDIPSYRRNMYGHAADCYMSAKEWLLRLPDSEQRLKGLLEVQCQLTVIHHEWGFFSIESMIQDTEALMKLIQKRMHELADSQILMRMYGRLCCLMADLLGEKLGLKNIGVSLYKELIDCYAWEQMWDVWSDRAIWCFEQLAGINSNPSFMDELCHIIRSKLQLTRQYQFYSKEMIRVIQNNTPNRIELELADEETLLKKRVLLLIRLIECYHRRLDTSSMYISAKNVGYSRVIAILSKNLLCGYTNLYELKRYSDSEFLRIQGIRGMFLSICEELLMSNNEIDIALLRYCLHDKRLFIHRMDKWWLQMKLIKCKIVLKRKSLGFWPDDLYEWIDCF